VYCCSFIAEVASIFRVNWFPFGCEVIRARMCFNFIGWLQGTWPFCKQRWVRSLNFADLRIIVCMLVLSFSVSLFLLARHLSSCRLAVVMVGVIPFGSPVWSNYMISYFSNANYRVCFKRGMPLHCRHNLSGLQPIAVALCLSPIPIQPKFLSQFSARGLPARRTSPGSCRLKP
jgi:hypothetical protein